MSIAIEDLLLGLTQQLQSESQQSAQQATLDTVLKAVNGTLTQVNATIALLTNPTYGLAALQSQIATLSGQLAIDVTALLTAIAATQQAANPVVLPSSYPGGWSSAIGTDSAHGVWNTPDAFTGATTLGDLSNLAVVLSNMGAFHTNPGDSDRPFHWISNLFQTSPFPITRTFSPQFPANTILPSDTIVTFLNTANPGWSWSFDDVANNWATANDPLNAGVTWYCDINAVQFAQLQSQIAGAVTTAPVWPGLAGVTLLTPVAIADGVTITEVMDGCLIAVTGYPLNRGQFSFNGVISVRNLGALAFFTDNGDEEFPQTLGFTSAVYLPKSMASAAGLVLRTTGGVTGTITPFTIP